MPAHTLDDAASLIVQLEPGDDAALRSLRSVLDALVFDPSIPSAARPHLAEAIEAASAKRSPDQPLIDALRRCIERACDPSAPEAPPPSAASSTAAGSVQTESAADGHADVAQHLPADADLELLPEFVTESLEYLQASEAALLLLESDPEDAEAVNTVFRAFHTIKGTSAFLGLDRISELAHHAETLLSRIRDREIRCTGGYAGLALKSVDTLTALLTGVQTALAGGRTSPAEGYGRLMEILHDPEAHGISEVERRAASPARRRIEEIAEREPARSVEPSFDLEESALPLAPRDARRQPDRSAADRGAEQSVRVRTDRLDRLIEMVGELVIAQSMISQDPSIVEGDDYALKRKVSHADKIVRELQDLSMSMRMVPLKGAFQKVARLVRDLAVKNGKEVRFVAEGEDTEIDRSMVDTLGDPLVHMVRNAVDHGIERPEDRAAAGKEAAGTVRLAAYHAGGMVVVELSDDGRGLDRERIVRKAVEKGLIDSGEGMSDADVFALIFAPGFSTAERITDVSGRGVGMDVVKRNIEKMRGRIEIASAPGRGTTFTVRLPLTLAITDGMLVRVGAERYIVPTTAIHISFRPERSALSTIAGRAEMVMLREDVMPLVRLHRAFAVEGAVEDPTQALLMVVGDGAQRAALLVDELLGQHHVVAKSLGEGVGRVRGVSGGAILGDGRVGLILDVDELLALARGRGDDEARAVA